MPYFISKDYSIFFYKGLTASDRVGNQLRNRLKEAVRVLCKRGANVLGSLCFSSGQAEWNVHRQAWIGAWNPPLKNDEAWARYLPLWASEPSDFNQWWMMLLKAVAPMGTPLVLLWGNHDETWIWSMETEISILTV